MILASSQSPGTKGTRAVAWTACVLWALGPLVNLPPLFAIAHRASPRTLSCETKSFACNSKALQLEAQNKPRPMNCWTRNQEAFENQVVDPWLNLVRLESSASGLLQERYTKKQHRLEAKPCFLADIWSLHTGIFWLFCSPCPRWLRLASQ